MTPADLRGGRPISRPSFLRAAAAAGASFAVPGPAAAATADLEPPGKPELSEVRVGIPVDAASFLPFYIAADRTWREQGLNATLVSFRGDAELMQALAGDSVHIACGGTSGLINMLTAGQPVIGFYAGFNLAGFSWYAQPSIRSWSDLRGKLAGVSTYGSTTDALTRYVLRRHGLEPERDVRLIQVGSTLSEYLALRSGRIAMAILSSPLTWDAQMQGFRQLGNEVHEIAPQWPEHIFSTKRSSLTQYPRTTVAVLRAHVAALRLARADRTTAVAVLSSRMKYANPEASRAYDEVMPTYDERGRLPEAAMPAFWQIAMRNGDVKRPLPERAFLDHRYIDSFASWAPR